MADKLAGTCSQRSRALRNLIKRVRLREVGVDVLLEGVRLSELLDIPAISEPIELLIPAKLKRSGMAMSSSCPTVP